MNCNNWGGKREGAGRKKTGKKTVSVTLTLSPEEAEELKYRASKELKTPSKYVVEKLHLDENLRKFESSFIAAEYQRKYNPD